MEIENNSYQNFKTSKEIFDFFKQENLIKISTTLLPSNLR